MSRRAKRNLPMRDGNLSNVDPNTKFDIQLAVAQEREQYLKGVFSGAKIEKIELKSESFQWEKTGNICIEYEHNGKPSGIAATEADVWVHELLRDGEPLCWVVIPVSRMKDLCRAFWHTRREGAGDGGKSKVILIPIKEILR